MRQVPFIPADGRLQTSRRKSLMSIVWAWGRRPQWQGQSRGRCSVNVCQLAECKVIHYFWYITLHNKKKYSHGSNTNQLCFACCTSLCLDLQHFWFVQQINCVSHDDTGWCKSLAKIQFVCTCVLIPAPDLTTSLRLLRAAGLLVHTANGFQHKVAHKSIHVYRKRSEKGNFILRRQ